MENSFAQVQNSGEGTQSPALKVSPLVSLRNSQEIRNPSFQSQSTRIIPLNTNEHQFAPQMRKTNPYIPKWVTIGLMVVGIGATIFGVLGLLAQAGIIHVAIQHTSIQGPVSWGATFGGAGLFLLGVILHSCCTRDKEIPVPQAPRERILPRGRGNVPSEGNEATLTSAQYTVNIKRDLASLKQLREAAGNSEAWEKYKKDAEAFFWRPDIAAFIAPDYRPKEETNDLVALIKKEYDFYKGLRTTTERIEEEVPLKKKKPWREEMIDELDNLKVLRESAKEEERNQYIERASAFFENPNNKRIINNMALTDDLLNLPITEELRYYNDAKTAQGKAEDT